MGTQTMGSNGGGQNSLLNGLSKQGSLYNLTLDEVQPQLGDLGKLFISMNLDELFKSVKKKNINDDDGGDGDDDDDDDDDISRGVSFKNGDRKRQATLGEMTLEDFLVKTGIVAESSPGRKTQEQILE
ncbi:hypothetical protein L1987_05566 [Smallanthus sonchifolius]|uniref:Uncharacterized protein n=1 Tax=Smallanthus sonchifolius TaxID=185202 RepID=A0ACB9JVV8_9ASTR|nr:hypothetical protein L1987_05566 [Smallanthus sonchifolius]